MAFERDATGYYSKCVATKQEEKRKSRKTFQKQYLDKTEKLKLFEHNLKDKL